METYEKVPRAVLVERLLDRDGNVCQHPSCGKPMNLENIGAVTDDPFQATIDHWMPQSWCRDNGWTMGEIWDLSNLKLMHKECNAKKGSLIPNDDGTLPSVKRKRSLRHRRAERAQRPEVCTACNSGRDLGPDELCAGCGSGPMPERFPRWAKVPNSRDCDHELFWCAWCSIGVIERSPAVHVAIRQSESGEWGDEPQ